MFYLFVNDEETNLLFEYHLIKMQLFLKKKIVLTMSLYYRAEEYHPVFIGGKKIFFFSCTYLMYVVEWNMNIDILTAIYLYLFKNVIQVRNLTCTSLLISSENIYQKMHLRVSDSITDAGSNERQDTNFQRRRALKKMLR